MLEVHIHLYTYTPYLAIGMPPGDISIGDPGAAKALIVLEGDCGRDFRGDKASID